MPPSSLADAVPTGPLFSVVLLLHVAATVVALGSVVVCGVQSARVLRAADGAPPPGLVAYFAPGVNWVGRTLYAVPILGLVLLGLSGGVFGFGEGWVQAGLVLWLAAAVLAEWQLWPAERRIQSGLADGGDAAAVRRACRTACWAATGLVVVLVVAIVLMVAQP